MYPDVPLVISFAMLASLSPQFPHFILGTDPVSRGDRPRKVCKKRLGILIFFAVIT